MCSLVNTVVGPLNASLLVDSQYGRSVVSPNLYFVAPDETLYNFEAYARMIYIKKSQNLL